MLAAPVPETSPECSRQGVSPGLPRGVGPQLLERGLLPPEVCITRSQNAEESGRQPSHTYGACRSPKQHLDCCAKHLSLTCASTVTATWCQVWNFLLGASHQYSKVSDFGHFSVSKVHIKAAQPIYCILLIPVLILLRSLKLGCIVSSVTWVFLL